MTLLRRRRRAVYRVYTEEQYLNGEERSNDAREYLDDAGLQLATHGDEARGRRLHRVSGVAMLAGAAVTVGGVVVLNGARTHMRAGRAPGKAVAAARPRVVPPSAIADARVAPFRPPAVHRTVARRSHARSLGRRRARPASHALVPRASLLREHAAVPVAYVSRPTPSEPVVADAPAAALPARSAPARRAEFGFER